MIIMNKLLYWVSSHLPCKIICDVGHPYLERYYLFTILNTRFYIHRFVGSDPARGLHNHPWRWAISLILSGYYLEHTHYGIKPVRWINGLVGDSFHRVILPSEHKFVWTLFFHQAGRAKTWGFLRNKGQLGTVYEEHKPSTTETGEPEDWWVTAPKGQYVTNRLES